MMSKDVSKRTRIRPEIPATRYSNRIPAEEYEISRAHYGLERAAQAWQNRPSLGEIAFIYLPVGMILAGAGVAIADEALELHLAKRMANVRVNESRNEVVQEFQKIVQQIGEQAVKAEE